MTSNKQHEGQHKEDGGKGNNPGGGRNENDAPRQGDDDDERRERPGDVVDHAQLAAEAHGVRHVSP